MPALIYVCVRCYRDAAPGQSGHGAGRALAQAFAALTGADLEVRQVACLNACPQPCNVALRGGGRQTLRFSRVKQADGAALMEFARAYWALAPGADAVTALPASLHAKLSQNTPPPVAPVDPS